MNVRLELETNKEVTAGDLNNGISFPLKEKNDFGCIGIVQFEIQFWLELQKNTNI
jgi:hypothetical protein